MRRQPSAVRCTHPGNHFDSCRGQVRLECRKNKQENFTDSLSSMKPEMQVPKDQLLDIKVPTALQSWEDAMTSSEKMQTNPTVFDPFRGNWFFPSRGEGLKI